MTIASYADGEGWAHPRVSTIVKATHLSKGTVCRAVAQLHVLWCAPYKQNAPSVDMLGAFVLREGMPPGGGPGLIHPGTDALPHPLRFESAPSRQTAMHYKLHRHVTLAKR